MTKGYVALAFSNVPSRATLFGLFTLFGLLKTPPEQSIIPHFAFRRETIPKVWKR
jgi:hypothetical protein